MSDGEQLLIDEKRTLELIRQELNRQQAAIAMEYVTRQELDQRLDSHRNSIRGDIQAELGGYQKQFNNVLEAHKTHVSQIYTTLDRHFRDATDAMNIDRKEMRGATAEMDKAAAAVVASLDAYKSQNQRLVQHDDEADGRFDKLERWRDRTDSRLDDLSYEIRGNPEDPEAFSIKRSMREEREYMTESIDKIMLAIERITDTQEQQGIILARLLGYEAAIIKLGRNGVQALWNLINKNWWTRIAASISILAPVAYELIPRILEAISKLNAP